MSERDPLLGRALNVRETNQTRVTVKDVGLPTVISTAPHSQTNHFIKQTRKYFPRQKLRTYVCSFPGFRFAAVLLLLASCLGALSLKAGYFIAAPAYCFLLCAIGLGIFFQHEVINRKSLPVLLLQPVFDGQRSLNAFYRVTVSQLNGITLENYRAGIGYLELSEGSIEFQAFNRRAVQSVRVARRFSRVLLFLFVCSAAYNLYFLMAVSFGIKY